MSTRARFGNQQPIYFWLTWLWQQLTPDPVVAFYGIEAWMRLTSVAISAVTIGGLVWLAGRTSGGLLGGVAAGGIASIDRNAIFFGTELRPYAAVMLCSLVACAAVVAPLTGSTRFRFWALNIAVLLAAMLHLTSLLVLGPLLLLFGLRHVRSRADLLPLIAWAVAAVYWLLSQGDVWSARHNWAAFAIPRRWEDVWRLWPWFGLVIVPFIGMVFWHVVKSRIARSEGRPGFRAISLKSKVLASSTTGDWVGGQLLLPMLAVLVGTSVCYLISVCELVPLWHRRYLIAALPILFWSFGHQLGRIAIDQRPLAIGCAILLTGVGWGSVMHHQRTDRAIVERQWRLAVRGEDWRGAVRYVNSNAATSTQVWVDPALIEQNGADQPIENLDLAKYLSFVIDGSYPLRKDLTPIPTGEQGTKRWGNQSKARWLITRRLVNAQAVEREIAVRRFGRVWVLQRLDALD